MTPQQEKHEAWLERAAIAEFEGGLTRDEAEKLATQITGYTPQPQREKLDDQENPEPPAERREWRRRKSGGLFD